jgi:hypothetical protein
MDERALMNWIMLNTAPVWAPQFFHKYTHTRRKGNFFSDRLLMTTAGGCI